jgi:hypothetical protein
MMTITKAVVSAGRAAHHNSGIFAGFDWSDGATIIAAVLAAFIAAVIAVVGYSIQRKITRRSERADLYGDAIGAVEAYLEGPYRIRRKTDDADNWFALSSMLSDAKTAISHHQALLEMHAPADVVAAYTDFVAAAIREAGPQMTAAWGTPPLSAPTDVPLGTGYDRTDSDAKRAVLVMATAADLQAIGTWWRLGR